jgi:hypothetical protein
MEHLALGHLSRRSWMGAIALLAGLASSPTLADQSNAASHTKEPIVSGILSEMPDAFKDSYVKIPQYLHSLNNVFVPSDNDKSLIDKSMAIALTRAKKLPNVPDSVTYLPESMYLTENMIAAVNRLAFCVAQSLDSISSNYPSNIDGLLKIPQLSPFLKAKDSKSLNPNVLPMLAYLGYYSIQEPCYLEDMGVTASFEPLPEEMPLWKNYAACLETSLDFTTNVSGKVLGADGLFKKGLSKTAQSKACARGKSTQKKLEKMQCGAMHTVITDLAIKETTSVCDLP